MPFLPLQSDGQAFNRLIGFMAWRRRHKTRHTKSNAPRKIAQIGFAVPPAALGSQLEPFCRLLHGEKKEAVGRKPGVRGSEHRSQVAEIDQRIGRQDQIVSRSLLGQRAFQIGGVEMIVDPARTRLLDHRGRQVHTIQPRCERPESKSGKSPASVLWADFT